jgi:adenine-specific DNA-methyltransferase
VQISDDGAAELEVLMKEIFCKERNNLINRITVRTKSPSGFASVNPGVFETAEYIYCFAKDKRNWTYNQIFTPTSYDSNYKWFIPNIDDDTSMWKVVDVSQHVAGMQGFKDRRDAIRKLGTAFNELVAEFALANASSVFQSTAIGDDAGSETVRLREESKSNPGVVFRTQNARTYDKYVYNGREMAFYSKKIRNINGLDTPTVQLTNIWNDISYEGIASEGGVRLKGGKKPEKLVARIIEMASNPGDLVIDYHLGSGTTSAVAHKLGRRYIGIEQLDYAENDSVIRLKNVIKGEQTGISKSVQWQGGGDFVYAHVKNDANDFRERVEAATTDRDLQDLLSEAQKSSFLSYRVDPAKLSPGDKDFKSLSIAHKKQLLLELIDNNTLYVNYSDINDKAFAISKEDKKHNAAFYGYEA